MRPSTPRCFAWLTLLPSLFGMVGQVSGTTHVVTFGGGGTPNHNQISLEKNVLYFTRVLADLGLGSVPHEVYFADGGVSSNSLQYRLPEDDVQKLAKLLGSLMLNNNKTDLRYRRVELPKVLGPASPQGIAEWFDTVGKLLKPGESLMFYFTGHGGPDLTSPSGPRNTTMHVWGGGGYPMTQFVAQLDKLDPAVPVTLVMVQCHSGGFANVIYNNGDHKKGFSKHLRCGFFATTAPRLAAGCTPDIDEEDYQEFSTFFFEALCGRTRTGKSVAKPDYDGDGVTSYTDAFTYVLLTSNTIDIPMTTSDQLLRDKSRVRKSRNEQVADLLPRNATWSQLLSHATPAQKAALEGLAQELELDGEDRLTRAQELATKLDTERQNLARSSRPLRPSTQETPAPQAVPAAPGEHSQHDQHSQHEQPSQPDQPSQPSETTEEQPESQPESQPATQSRNRDFNRRLTTAANRLRTAVGLRWPELAVPYHPDAPRLLEAQGAEIRKLIESHPAYKDFQEAVSQRDASINRQRELERKWVKCQRLLERGQTVILAANLPKVADAGVVEHYRKLLQLENQTLASERAPGVPRSAAAD